MPLHKYTTEFDGAILRRDYWICNAAACQSSVCRLISMLLTLDEENKKKFIADMAKDKIIDWCGFWINFFFGALFGGVLGLGLWAKSGFENASSGIAGVICIGGGALLIGLVVGCRSDGFWEGFRDSNWWRFWP